MASGDIAVVGNDVAEFSATLIPQEASGHRNIIRVLQQSGQFELIGFRVLNGHRTGFPVTMIRHDLALDWIALLSIKNDQATTAHLLRIEEDEPVYFSHTLTYRNGRTESLLDFDLPRLMRRFPRLMERFAQSASLTASVVTQSGGEL